MFTGIITDIGHIEDIEHRGDLRVKISCSYAVDQIPIGASICCSGACLTVVSKGNDWFCVDVSKATLDATILGDWKKGTSINLEQSLKLGEELGGHLVTGHVDGVAELVEVEEVGDSKKLTFKAPDSLKNFIAEKGSITLNGVSLTVNAVSNNVFTINIIPHTWDFTTFKNLTAGSEVNIEIDIIARYVARLMKKEVSQYE
jgi:riboflavin synthase